MGPLLVAALLANAAAHTCTGEWHENSRWSDRPIHKWIKQATADDCCAACANDDECVQWTQWCFGQAHPFDCACKLYSGDSGRSVVMPEAGYTCGMKRGLTSPPLGPPEVNGQTMINDGNLIARYNSANGATWVAGHNDFFNGMTFDDARPILGTALSHVSEHLNNTLSDSVYAALGDAPAEFDARSKWAGLIHPIRNQLHCGSCWAFSASEVLSDRVAIANGKESPVLSAEDLVSCDSSDMGCKGGRLSSAWNFIKNDGLVTDTCFPYTAGGGVAPACRTKCVDSEAFTRTKAMSAYAINGLTNMQKEMLTNGPIQVAFMVYKSFMSYKSGVYQKHFWELLPEGGHAVKMIGWGSESNTDYWLVANSWGTTQWGSLGGFFKIKRGVDECGIESMGPPYAGIPAKSVVVV